MFTICLFTLLCVNAQFFFLSLLTLFMASYKTLAFGFNKNLSLQEQISEGTFSKEGKSIDNFKCMSFELFRGGLDKVVQR